MTGSSIDLPTSHKRLCPCREEGHAQALAHSDYALPRWDLIKLLTDRQWKLFLRDKALTNFRVIQVIVVGLIVGSLFGHLGHTPDRARSYFGVSFLCIMFLAMGSAIQMALLMQTKG